MCPASSQDSGPRIEQSNPAHNGDGSAPDPLEKLAAFFMERFAAVSGSIRTLFAVHTDRAQLAIRRRVQLAILALAGVFAGSTALVYSVYLVIRGTMLGFAELFGGRAWLGSLVTGLVILGAVGGALLLALRRWDRNQLKKQEAKYDELRRKSGGLARRGDPS
jgi:hypothetical protein